jgi:hypothetical protein
MASSVFLWPGNATLSGNVTITGTLNVPSIEFTGASAATPPQMTVGGVTLATWNNGGGGGDVWENTFLGYKAGNAFATSSTGYANTVVGKGAGLLLNGNAPNAASNVFLGYAAGAAVVTGSFNTFVGTAAGTTYTGSSATFLGYHAGVNALGANNTFVGNLTGRSGGAANGISNTAVGDSALTVLSTGNSNAAFGISTLEANTTGGNNSALGSFALRTNISGSGNVGVGYFAGAYETGSNALYIDNQNRTNTAGDKAGAIIYGTFNATPSSQTITFNVGTITHGSTTLMATSVALTNGAAAQTGTLTNAPTAGNPTKWVPINDNGTTRYVPAW